MEDLNKTQIILLTLLITFVTSIGTGIITFSLLQQVPTEVTHTINRVVERTIEKVTPQPGATSTKEITVVVKEEDSIIDAISKNSPSLVRITSTSTSDTGETKELFYGLGIIISKDGLVASVRKDISPALSLTALFSDGTSFPLKALSNSATSSFVFFSVDKTSKPAYVFNPVDLGDSQQLRLGQSAVELGGKERDKVAIGRISELFFSQNSTTATSSQSKNITAKFVLGIQTDIVSKDTSVGGSPLLDLSGSVIGIKAFQSDTSSAAPYTAINMLKKELLTLPVVSNNNNQ